RPGRLTLKAAQACGTRWPLAEGAQCTSTPRRSVFQTGSLRDRLVRRPRSAHLRQALDSRSFEEDWLASDGGGYKTKNVEGPLGWLRHLSIVALAVCSPLKLPREPTGGRSPAA